MMSEHPPPSILRRNGHRLSIPSATRQSLRKSFIFDNSNTPSINIGNGGGIGSAKRKSLILTPASSTSKRRLSSFLPSSQQTPNSSQQIPLHTSQIPLSQQLQLQAQQKVDPRPLRDKNYISLIQQEIFDFLSVNKFEVESNHSLTLKTLRQPTQKDFVLIYQFLYHKVDPFYQFAKNFDTDVLTSLKMLNYPYIDTLNRSLLSSVSPQNWPNVLGMLYWLVKLNLRISVFDISEFLNSESTLVLPDDKLDQIFINYTRAAYQSYLQNDDNYQPFYEEMISKYEAFRKKLSQDITDLEKVTEQLSSEFKSLEQQLQLIESNENQLRALETDLVQLKAYNETLESARTARQEKLALIQEELDRQDQKLESLREQKAQCEAELKKNGLNVVDIDKLLNERDLISREITKEQETIDKLNNDYQIKEIDIHKKFESLNNFINQYNNIVDRLTRSRESEIRFSDLKLTIGSNLLDNGANPHDPMSILSNKVLSEERSKLENFRMGIRNNFNELQKKSIEIQGELDVMEGIKLQLQEKFETLEDDFARSVRTSDSIKEYGTNVQHSYAISIHKLHNEIKDLKFNSNNKEILLETDNILRDLEMKFGAIEREVFHERMELQTKVYELIDDIIKFKLHIQEKLEEVSTLALEESKEESSEV